MPNHWPKPTSAIAACLTLACVWMLAIVVFAAPLPEFQQRPSGSAGAAAPQAGYVGESTCLGCHESEGKSIHATPHGRAANPRTPMAAQGCETCHGPGQKHADSGEQGRHQGVPGNGFAGRERDVSHVSCADASELPGWPARLAEPDLRDVPQRSLAEV